MKARPITRLREGIDSLFDKSQTEVEVIPELGRLGAQVLLQMALDAEVTLQLGRHTGQQRTVGRAGVAPVVRSGHRVVVIKTTAGPVRLWWPRLRGGQGGFVSRIYGMQTIDVEPLIRLFVTSHVRRLDATEVHEALVRAFGLPAAVASTVLLQGVSHRMVVDCEAWGRRRLEGMDLGSLRFVPGRLAVSDVVDGGPVLAVGGVSGDGDPSFLGLSPGAADSVEAWTALLTDLAARGLDGPASVAEPVPSALVTALSRAFFAVVR
ncbi:transposase [Actinomadura terrae]|uniref:transposase n=1 Tax=Actinomadura terrae TaxID=604353 RepID=UPI001FA7EEBC|nr:transposase [Actinomadura terrae]